MNQTETTLTDKYEGLWLAIDRETRSIVGRGMTPKEALALAKASGVARAVAIFVTPETIAFAGLCDPSLAEASGL
jgi:hypothetical protein